MMSPLEKGKMNAALTMVTLLIKRFGPVAEFSADEMNDAIWGDIGGFKQTLRDDGGIVIAYDPDERKA